MSELDALEAALFAARSGMGRTVVVEGPAGIGKTSLLARATERASASGMATLRARGSQLEREYAMGVVRQCFEPELRRVPDPEAVLKGAAQLAARVVLEVPDRGGPAPAGVLHGLYWLTANLAERVPLLIAIDDAHWADDASLLFVAYLARRIESLPVALVIGTREAEDAATGAVLEDIRREPMTRLLEPAPLDVAGVEQLLRELRRGPVEREFAVACHNASGGNPFLLGELIRTLGADDIGFTARNAERLSDVTPPTVARSVRATLDRLGPAPQALARAVAVLGDDVALDLAADLAGLQVSDAAAAAGEIVNAGLLADHASLRFRHPLLAGGVRATLSAPERAAAHARAAALLRARGAGPERVALQLMHAAPAGDRSAAAELREAAEQAHGRGAPVTAIALLRRALAEPPPESDRAEILLELGTAEMEVGRSGDAAAHVEQARRCATEPVLRGRATLALFQAVGGVMQRIRDLAPLVAEAREEVAPHDRELALRLWTIHMITVSAQELPAVRQGALELPGDTAGEALVLGHLVYPLMYSSTAAEVADIVDRVARQADALIEHEATSLVITSLFLGLHALDRLDEAGDVLDRAADVARRRGSGADLTLAQANRADVHRRAGRLRDAETDARLALATAGEAGWAGGGLSAITPLVGTLVDQGRADDAERELAAAFPGEREIPDAPATNFLFFERIGLRMLQGRHAAALEEFDEAVRRSERVFGIDCVHWVGGLGAAAEAHAALGDHHAAAGLADRAVGVARRWGTPGYIGQALHAKARVCPDDDAIETLREAVAQLETSPAQLELARSLVTLGGFLRRRGARVESREPLREGFALAQRCGADGLAESARAELRASGIRVRRDQLDGREALTASERRIAELAAAGASNREIAQALFLTVKTVEMHLTRAYRKLGISRRGELAAALPAH